MINGRAVFLGLAIMFFFANYVFAANWTFEEKLPETQSLQVKQESLIQQNADITEIISLTHRAMDKISEIDKKCAEVSWIRRSSYDDIYSDCLETKHGIAKVAATMKINAAKYCAQKGLVDKAKELYREVIITFTGDSYRSYVKQAEFGLEDLRSLEKKMEQEKEEKEKADREAKDNEEQAAKKTLKKKPKK